MEIFLLFGVLTTIGMTIYSISKYQRSNLLFAESYGADDVDIKIAGESTVNEPQNTSEELEQLAELIKSEHDNGNIERAKRLAVALVETVFSNDVFTHDISDAEKLQQIKILITFSVDICLENGLPNSIVAQSAQNLFYEQISLRDRDFYDDIQTTGAFSMYLLCTRSETANSVSIGEEFATLCMHQNDKEYTKLGQDIFEYYLKLCADKIKEAKFVK